MKNETCKLYCGALLDISTKFHQNWSLQFRAIPFQSWWIFGDSVEWITYDELYSWCDRQTFEQIYHSVWSWTVECFVLFFRRTWALVRLKVRIRQTQSLCINPFRRADLSVCRYWLLPFIGCCLNVLCPVWARERCRISSSRFLAECRKRRLNPG